MSPEDEFRLIYDQASEALQSAMVGGRIKDFSVKQSKDKLDISITYYQPADNVILSADDVQRLFGHEERKSPAQQMADEIDAKFLKEALEDLGLRKGS